LPAVVNPPIVYATTPTDICAVLLVVVGGKYWKHQVMHDAIFVALHIPQSRMGAHIEKYTNSNNPPDYYGTKSETFSERSRWEFFAPIRTWRISSLADTRPFTGRAAISGYAKVF